MADEGPTTIQRVRECLKCGYNLYGLARQGTCPECGHPYKRRQGDAVAKNPRRQLPPLRRMLREQERVARWYPLTWVVLLALGIGLYYLHAPMTWWVILGIASAVNGMIHYGAVYTVRHYRQKIEAVDQTAGARQHQQ